MKTAPRVNYVGPSEIEYTEIRPIRPNQSVILAGLGVTGSRLTANTKDRRYRSTQGAGYSDGLVIHTRPRPSTQPRPQPGLWTTPPPAILERRQRTAGAGVETTVQPHYDLREQRIMFEDELFVPVPATTGPSSGLVRSNSVSPVRSPQHPMNTASSNRRSVATTYDLFFDQHLQNIAHLEEEAPSRLSFSTRSATPVTARYREASCQTPTNIRLSPLIFSRVGGSQTDLSVPRIIEDCLQEEEDDNKENLDDNQDVDGGEITDDELDMIGDFMVQESLDVAATDLDNSLNDFSDLGGELSPSDLRPDQFTAKDYYRAGLSPPPDIKQDPSMEMKTMQYSDISPRKSILNAVPEADEEVLQFETVHVNSSKISRSDICKELQSPRKVVRKK